MNDFISKPFDVETLITLVHDLTHGVQRRVVTVPDRRPREALATDAMVMDWSAGLKTWRDAHVYQKHLGLFARDHAHDVQHMEALFQSGKIHAAKDLVHRLRGAAGALALSRLFHLTTQLEDALIDGEAGTEVRTALPSAMALSLDAIAACIATPSAVTAPPGATTAAQPGTPVHRNTALQKLLVSLNSDDPNVIEPTLPSLASALSTDTFDAICACVDTFDFRGAEKLVHALMAEK